MRLTIPVEDRVHNGAIFLDEVAPGWEHRINPYSLRLDDGHSCICGQVFSDKAHMLPKIEGFDLGGFGWAEKHLFTQGSAWVESISLAYGLDPKDTEDVAYVLGFDILYKYTEMSTATETEKYWELQIAWMNFLEERAANKQEELANAEGLVYTKLDPEFKSSWLKALRSGNYKQGKGSLRAND